VCTPLPPLLNLSRISCLPRSQPRGYALACRHHEASGAEIVPGRHSARTRHRRHRARGRIFFLTCPRKSLWPCWCEMVSYPQNLQMVTLRMFRFFCVSVPQETTGRTQILTPDIQGKLAYTHAHFLSHALHHQSAYTLSTTRVHTFTHTEQVRVHTHTHTHTNTNTQTKSAHAHTHTRYQYKNNHGTSTHRQCVSGDIYDRGS
jgi:hypothetical protein